MGLNLENGAAKVAKAKAATVGLSQGSNAGRYAGVESVAASGTPTATGGAQAAQITPTTPTAPAAAPPTVYQPYLTAPQNAAYTSAMQKDQGVIGGAAAQAGTLKNKFLQDSASNGAKAATSFNNTNQSDAARGFGFSGIHDTAMADIQGNALINQGLYNTAYTTGLGTLANNVTTAQNDIGTLGQEYAGIASENANTDATNNGGVLGTNSYALPTVAAPAATAAPAPVSPVTYFQSPNMGAINSSISSGAAAGTAAGV